MPQRCTLSQQLNRDLREDDLLGYMFVREGSGVAPIYSQQDDFDRKRTILTAMKASFMASKSFISAKYTNKSQQG